MGRRSDHTRAELEALIIDTGHRLLAEVGYAGFSAREVAKRIGYSVGTIYNVFDNLDDLMLALNGRTFLDWAEAIAETLSHAGPDRIAVLVASYFDFATTNRNLWMAIYDHRLPVGVPFPERYARQRGALTDILRAEIAAVLPPETRERAPALARSLLATVHGHCVFALNGTFALLQEQDPHAAALARVREALRAAGADLPD
ncbi:MAG: TetR/AcrR family transcriptional regulator [Sphingomonas sp.]|uniref:TetR/AcrR family transcriptional regulator n=1 Tax=Sphingomonas sp. TaxID=28214 RepID=UPI003F7D992F